jgi:hypothetical protein
VTNFGQSDYKSYYSFDMPFSPTPTPSTQPDVEGCLVRVDGEQYVWIVHNDSTRNWISSPSSGCEQKALPVPASQLDAYPKRHGAQDPRYVLNASQSALACQHTACSVAPVPPSTTNSSGLHFVVLNGDYNAKGEAWFDIDGQPKEFQWNAAWVPTTQMEWWVLRETLLESSSPSLLESSP